MHHHNPKSLKIVRHRPHLRVPASPSPCDAPCLRAIQVSRVLPQSVCPWLGSDQHAMWHGPVNTPATKRYAL